MHEKFMSYCVSCMNRLWQLEQTLPYNLSVLKSDEEICLVNYNSKDGLHEFILRNFTADIAAGKLRYFYTKEPDCYDSPIAKNAAHRLASGRILFNLDADNFIQNKTREYIANCVNTNPTFALQEFSGDLADGSFGRIALDRYSYDTLGGYNESLRGMGWQDKDLLQRAQLMGVSVFRAPGPAKAAVTNGCDNNGKLDNCATVIKDAGYAAVDADNEATATVSISRGEYQANPGGPAAINGVIPGSPETVSLPGFSRYSKPMRAYALRGGDKTAEYGLDHVEAEALDNLVRNFNVKRVLEFGPGSSTEVFINAGVPSITSVEFDQNYANIARERFSKITECVRVLHGDYSDQLYLGLPLDVTNLMYDLILVDAPVGVPYLSRFFTARFAREHAPLWLIHDSKRGGEKQTITELCAGLSVTQLPSIRGFTLLTKEYIR